MSNSSHRFRKILRGCGCQRWAISGVTFCIAILVGTHNPVYCQVTKRAVAKKGSKAAPPLPKNFSPPPEIPEVMTIEKSLMTDEEEEAFLKSTRKGGARRAFSDALKNNTLNNATKTAIENGAKFYVYRMTMKKHRRNLPRLREEIQRLFRLTLKEGKNAVRSYLLDELVKRASDLMDNNFHVRLNTIYMLSELNLKEPVRRSNKDAVSFGEAYKPLVDVLNDDEQMEAIQIAAAVGLDRIMLYGDDSVLTEPRRIEVAQALAKRLTQKDTHYWYQMVLARALASVGTIYVDRGRKTEGVKEVLIAAAVDENRHWMVRSKAVRALGRIPLKSQPMIFELSKLSVILIQQMAGEYNKAPKMHYWKGCFWDMYLTFKPENPNAARRWPVAGLLAGSSNSNRVRNAYAEVVPLVRHVLKNQPLPIPDALIDANAKWLKANPPNGTIAKYLNGQPN